MISQTGSASRWAVWATVAMGTFMATIDGSIVNVALPTITGAFHVKLVSTEWVVLSYLLAITSLLPTFGRLADIHGRRVLYILGFSIFTAGSVMCGLSGSVASLVAFRVIQAVGAAMTMANSFAVIADVFPGSERGRALGLMGTVVAAGTSFGPTAGGLILASLGWRWVFLVNLPIGIVGVLMALRTLPRPAGAKTGETLDLTGAFVFALSMSLFLMGLTFAPKWGWLSARSITLALLSAIGFWIFFSIEKRVSQPMVNLSIFRHKVLSFGLLAAVVSFVAQSGQTLVLPFFLTEAQGFGTAKTGLLLTSVPLMLSVVAPLSGWLSERLGNRLLSSIGMAVAALSSVPMLLLPAHAGALRIALSLMPLGVGLGLFQSPNNNAVMGSAPKDKLGVASGLLALARNLGMVLGVAMGGTIHNSFTHTGSGMPGPAAGLLPYRAVFAASGALFLIAILVIRVGTAPVQERMLPQAD